MKLSKCLKCGSIVKGFPCVHCTEVWSCNSCLKKFKGSRFDLNCPECSEKIKKIERDTDGVFIREVKFFPIDWNKRGVEVIEKKPKQMISVEKQGNKEVICDFKIKEKSIRETI